MKSETLKTGLSTLTQVTNSPVLLAVKANVLHIGGHTESSTLVMKADVVHDDFHIVLPPEHAKQLSKVLAKKGELELSEDSQGNLIVTQGNSVFTYTTLPVESVSYQLLMHYYKEEFMFSIDGELFSKGVQVVLNFSGGDINDVRAKNVHMNVEEGFVELAASNGSSLAVYKFPLTENYGKGDLPVTLIGRVVSILGKTMPGQVQFGVGPKRMYYKAKDATFTYMGVFPKMDNPPFPYKPLVANLAAVVSPPKAIIERDDFLERAKAVMYFTEESVKNRVEIEFDPDSITLEGDNERGSFRLDINPIVCDITGKIKISLDYLIRVASVSSGAEMLFNIVDNKFFLRDGMFTCDIPQHKS